MTEFGPPQGRGRVARRAFGRVEKSLGPTLEPDEQLQSAFFCHRYVPGLQLLLFLGSIGDILYMVIARPYYVALTSRRFLLLNASRWGLVSRPREPVFSSELDSVRIDPPRKFLLRATTVVKRDFQDEVRLAVHRQYWRELDHMRSLLDQHTAG